MLSKAFKAVLRQFAFCIACDFQINRKGEIKFDLTITNETNDNESVSDGERINAIGFVLSNNQLNTSEAYEDET